MAADSTHLDAHARSPMRLVPTPILVACFGMLLAVAGDSARTRPEGWAAAQSIQTNWRFSPWLGYGSRVEKSLRFVPALHDAIWPPLPTFL